MKHVELPGDTFILAALIIRELGSNFYDEWYIKMSEHQQKHTGGRPREIIIVAAMVTSVAR